ncbi:unnamed protein product [Peronospora effusa]|uniref:Uncharacterized protein n=1 Tax=Peronospora effusa TaxID=542832 RepID=A0A3M6VJ76_9STRA|nr:hypothetical protein DD238_002101 [Peronospora effusa]RQM18280.1 hypothetical protein DD237_000106 [Peronospora effusa]CAI5725656.1 unnamed protein product [Peronospora effusa]
MPPADDENVKTTASVDVTAMQTTLDESVQVPAQLRKASSATGSPKVASVESEGEEEDEMVDALEDLILEAYNNMQIDGEYIFLPEKVAEKLHQVAEQIKLRQSEEEQQKERNRNAGQDSNGGDNATRKADVGEVKVLPETLTDRPETEKEKEQKQEKAQAKKHEKASVDDARDNTSKDDKTRQHKVQLLQAKASELREEQHKQRIPRVMSTENIFMELPSVPEIDEMASSRPPSPSPPLSRSHSAPKTRIQTPTQSRRCFPSPPLFSLTTPPSAKPDHTRKLSVSRTPPVSRTPDQSDGSKRKSKVLTYGTRREAALRQKEDKMKRELLVRETARKQREDSKRQLEEAHQREIEEKREHVRRIREERLLRRTEKLTGAKGAKKKG